MVFIVQNDQCRNQTLEKLAASQHIDLLAVQMPMQKTASFSGRACQC